MKKLLSVLITVLLLCGLCACTQESEKKIEIREYNGPELVGLMYKTVDYNGGYTVEYLFDFKAKTAAVGWGMPGSYSNPEVFCLLKESDIKPFTDKCFSYGLYSLDREYRAQGTIMDGGGWTLEITYADGKASKHSGSNAGPYEVFNNCATAFYDLCGMEVMGRLPENYTVPPTLSIGVKYPTETGNASFETQFSQRGNCKWNKKKVSDTDYYRLNELTEPIYDMSPEVEYKFFVHTANYRYQKKYSKCILRSYDYCEEMTGEKEEWSVGFENSTEVNLEADKIYICRLEWTDGNYVEYTFNTRIGEE